MTLKHWTMLNVECLERPSWTQDDVEALDWTMLNADCL